MHGCLNPMKLNPEMPQKLSPTRPRSLLQMKAPTAMGTFSVLCVFHVFFFLRGFPMDFATDFRWFSLFFHLGGDQNQHPICEDILYDWFYDVGLEDEQYHEKKHNIYIHSPTIIYVILKIFEAY